MAVGRFTFPKEWQDWSNLLLGIWLLVSPWTLRFSDDTISTQIAVYIGFLIVVAEVFTFHALRAVEEWINVILSVLLIHSPWIFGITRPTVRWNFVVAGLVIILLAFYEIWDARRPMRTHE